MQEVEAKRKLTPADGAHIFYTSIFLTGCYIVKSSYSTVCGDNSISLDLFIDLLFYGQLIWATFLIISLIPRYKNENLRLFFNLLDLMYGLFHVAMVIFGCTLYFSDKAEDCVTLAPQAHFLTHLYILITGFAALFVLIGFGMWVFRKNYKSTDLGAFNQTHL